MSEIIGTRSFLFWSAPSACQSPSLSDTSMSQGDEFSDESVPEEFCDPITLMLMVPAFTHDLR